MSRLSIALALLLLTAAAAQAAADPHAERVRLTPADTALARRTVLQRGDVVADWKAMSIPRIPGGRLPCPDFNPDFSAFTVTGKAATAFSHPTGGSIISTLEVYASRADAVGDFQVGAQPGVAKCLRTSFAKALGTGAAEGVRFRIASSGMVTAPRVGERSFAFRLSGDLNGSGQHVPVYVDMLGFQRGRSIASFVFVGARKPIAATTTLALRVDARMR